MCVGGGVAVLYACMQGCMKGGFGAFGTKLPAKKGGTALPPWSSLRHSLTLHAQQCVNVNYV